MLPEMMWTIVATFSSFALGMTANTSRNRYAHIFLFFFLLLPPSLLTSQWPQDSFLHLTGPSRAIMSTDTVQIEIQLKVKGRTKSEDRSLITKVLSCNDGDADPFITHSIHGCFCRMELCCGHLDESIQATIVSVRVKQGPLFSADGVQIICSSMPEEHAEGKAEHTTNHVVLLDKKGGTVTVHEEGYLDLSRQIVSVQLEGRLEVMTKTFQGSGVMRSGCVVFEPKRSNISKKECIVGDCKLEITVAWSLLVADEQSMLGMSYTKPCLIPSQFPFMNIYLPPLHIYLLFCIHYYLNIILTPCA